jgi:DNA mismatch repair protein MutS
MALITEYLRLTENYKNEYSSNTIIFMQNGAFFEVYALRDENNNYYGSNISDFSKICDLNIVDKKSQGNSNVMIGNLFAVNAGFKTHLVDKYIKKMQEIGYTIVIYEEDEEQQDSYSKKNGKTRSLTDIYSPGTYISLDNVLDEELNNNICCIWIEKKQLRSKKHKQINIFIGIGLIDVYTGKTYISEYKEEWIKNPTTFDELERFISTYNPTESIIISNLDLPDINDVMSFCNIKSKSLHMVNLNDDTQTKSFIRASNVEKQRYQTEILNKFYEIVDINSFMTIFYENVYATQAFCYLLDFVYQHNPNLTNKLSEPIFENNNDKLILANHSLKQLNIIGDNNFTGKYSSVSKMLNLCITSIGKREFKYNFLNPTTNIDNLNKEYDIIEYLLQNKNKYILVKSFLSSIDDLSKIHRQMLLRKSTPKMIYRMYQGINISKNMYENCIANDTIICSYLNEKIKNFKDIMYSFSWILQYIDDKLIIEECKNIDNLRKIDTNFINNGVDSKLDEEMEMLIDNQDKLECYRSYLNSMLHNNEISKKNNKKTNSKSKSKPKLKFKNISNKDNPGQDQDQEIDNEDTNNDNYNEDEDENENENENEDDQKKYVTIHITEKNNIGLIATSKRCEMLCDIIKNKKQNEEVCLNYTSNYFKCEKTFIVENDKLSFIHQSASKKYLTNVQIQSICNTLTDVKSKIMYTMEKVFEKIVTDMDVYSDKIEQICNFIKFVDLIYAKMYIADKFNYCRPVIVTNCEKSFVNVSGLRHCLIEKIQQNELYVTNDLEIGNGEMNGMLLYGTNAVGKTSFIRALGIATIMAQSGLYVPASSFEYNPYKYIFTRILGNDNIFKGLSTFAVEMSELRTILRLSNKNSLVLGDELCSGTESTSATSIFVSGIQHLNQTKCSFIFATHLHEILEYDEIIELEKVKIKHMSVIYNKETGSLEYDRKLKDGSGNNMYGLEVCKSLSLPEDFLENAHNIRMKYHPESASILDRRKSHFNAKKIVGTCEMCNSNLASEVHHLQYQCEADENGIISKNNSIFHKNHEANLLNICENCHQNIHKEKKQYKKVKTTKGMILKEI